MVTVEPRGLLIILIICGMSHEQLKAFVLEMFIHVHVSAGVINWTNISNQIFNKAQRLWNSCFVETDYKRLQNALWEKLFIGQVYK